MNKTFGFCKCGGADFFPVYERWCTGVLHQVYREMTSIALLGFAQANPDLTTDKNSGPT